jgi:hypothetical protein
VSAISRSVIEIAVGLWAALAVAVAAGVTIPLVVETFIAIARGAA